MPNCLSCRFSFCLGGGGWAQLQVIELQHQMVVGVGRIYSIVTWYPFAIKYDCTYCPFKIPQSRLKQK